jgi:hypothetical protein
MLSFTSSIDVPCLSIAASRSSSVLKLYWTSHLLDLLEHVNIGRQSHIAGLLKDEIFIDQIPEYVLRPRLDRLQQLCALEL